MIHNHRLDLDLDLGLDLVGPMIHTHSLRFDEHILMKNEKKVPSLGLNNNG